MPITTNLDALKLLRTGDRPALRDYVVNAAGAWQADDGDDVLRLAGDDDAVTLAGPLDLTVAVEAENVFEPVQSGGNKPCGCQHTELWSYEVSVPAGHTWSYDLKQLAPYRVGANRGCRVVIRPRRPRAPTPTQASGDLPCGYAVENLADTGRFFPSACEPCGDRPVRPPTAECGPRLEVPIARGGCVRPRFFNGMAIAREDLETELRYLRLKLKLHNRAAGTGVVWGFDVALRGSKVVVGPGYGVDCCGNDLTVTCDYAVATEVLLRDPTVCRDVQRGRDCFALLLEYVECPEEPRPVHGNGCSPQAVACEYSRVRESVRLRLVPPRELPENPLARFMATLQALVAPATTTTAPAAAPTPAVESWESAPAGTLIPWQLRVTNPKGSQTLRPSTSGSVATTLPAVKPGGEPVDLAVVLDGGTEAIGGTIAVGTATAPFTGAAPSLHVNSLANPPPASQAQWESAGAQHLRGTTPVQLTYEITPELAGVVRDTSSQNRVYIQFPGERPAVNDQLLIRNQGGNTVATATVVDTSGTQVIATVPPDSPVKPGFAAVRAGVAFLRVTLPPSRVQVAVQPTGLPCCGGSCCGPTAKPTLSESLRLLAIALLYGKLLQLVAARGGQASDATALKLVALLRAQLGVGADRIAEAEDAIVELYRAWCAAGIYEGPECRDRLDGVVIGCATICAGDICTVDPLGGRRWVVHQPLVDHWGAQLGIPPLDITMDAVFSKLCCLSHLPGFGELVRNPENQSPTGAAAAPAMTGEYASLASLRSASTDASLQPLLATFGGAALATDAGGAAATSSWTKLLAGVPSLDLGRMAALLELLFCAQDRTALAPGAAVGGQRVAELVDSSMSRLAARRQPQPLLRVASSELARAVVGLVPAAAAVADDSALRPALAKAGIATVADLAARQPEDLQRLAATAPPDAVNEAATRAEEVVEETVDAVGEATRALAAKGLATPTDLAKPEIAERLAKEVASRLAKRKLTVDPAAVTKAVLALGR